MSIIDKFLGIMAPHDCLACGAEGDLLCPTCLQLFPDIPGRCYRCRKIAANYRTCSTCRRTSRLFAVRAATDYESIAQNLVWKLKFAGAQAATRQMTHCMLPLVAAMARPDTLLVPVPTATSRVRQRGYDQAKLLARELSRYASLPHGNCLARLGQSHQVGASRQQRLQQLTGAFHVAKPHLIYDAHVILIDDVLTTGATLEAAAQVLKQAGARRIDAAVFAQA